MREFANIKISRKSKEGDYNMCKAVMELKEEGKDILADVIVRINSGESPKIIIESGVDKDFVDTAQQLLNEILQQVK